MIWRLSVPQHLHLQGLPLHHQKGRWLMLDKAQQLLVKLLHVLQGSGAAMATIPLL
jgi:hypothetical protein